MHGSKVDGRSTYGFSRWLLILLALAVGLIAGGVTAWKPVWAIVLGISASALVVSCSISEDSLLKLFAFLLPFSIRLPSESLPLATTALLLYFIVIRAILTRRRISLTRTNANVLVIGLLAVGGISTIAGIDPFNSLRKLYNTMNFALVFWAVTHLVADEKRVRFVVRYVMISGVLLSLVGLLQFAGGVLLGLAPMKEVYLKMVLLFEGPRVFRRTADWTAGYFANWYSPPFGLVRAIGTSFSPMAFAQILLLSFFPLVTLALTRSTSRHRWLLILAVVVEGAAILSTLSRGAWLSLGIGGLVVGYSLFLRGRLPVSARGTILLGVLGVVLVVMAVAFAPQSFGEAARGAIASILRPTEVEGRFFGRSNEARFRTYGLGLEVIRQNPWLGVGPGNFAKAVGVSEGGSTHNVYLNVAAEMGLLGLVFYVGILLSAWRSFWLVIRRSRNRFLRAVSTGWLASLTALLAYWLFTAYFFEPKLGMTLWLVLGVSAVLRKLVWAERARLPQNGGAVNDHSAY